MNREEEVRVVVTKPGTPKLGGREKNSLRTFRGKSSLLIPHLQAPTSRFHLDLVAIHYCSLGTNCVGVAVLCPQEATGTVCLPVAGAVPGTKYHFSDISERPSLKHAGNCTAIGHMRAPA